MSGTCQVLDDYAPKRKPQLPGRRPIFSNRARLLITLIGLLGATVCAVQFVRGFVGEYHQVRVERDALQLQCDILEGQLAEMLRHGDRGILVANIGPDLAGYQLRLVPQQFNGRK